MHHAGAQNAFNLADDLLEVLRPLADWTVFHLTGQGRRPAEAGLTREQRQSLAGVLLESLLLDGTQVTVLPAADAMVASLVRALSGEGAAALRLPAL